MKHLRYILSAVLVFASLSVYADEGMWMIQDINAALEKNMKARGLKLSSNEIYNADAPGTAISDAVVSLGFYCTGSVISNWGLIITNHHCAYANIAKLSTPEHNYLEDGFWAMNTKDEIKIEGEKVYFLKRVFDVTDEVDQVARDLSRRGQPAGMRKISHILETRYKEGTGLECILSSMWAGEKYYMSVYKVYDDVRLVAAPPLCIGYFGGDEDNWEWPRHNCDFAMYRIYENGKPVTREKSLRVSLAGYKEGSFAMVIGYPGRTDRYASPAEIGYQEEVNLPVSNDIRAKQMSIVSRWMDADPKVRMKYSDWYFSLSNVQENGAGMEKCYKRFHVRDEKLAQERKLGKWIESAHDRREKWGTLIPDLEKAYSDCAEIERDKIYFRETMLRGTNIARYLLRAGNSKEVDKARQSLLEGLANTDARVEKDLLACALEEYFSNLDTYYFGEYQSKIWDRFGTDFHAMAEYLWNRSVISSESRIKEIESLDEVLNDPLRRFMTETSATTFNDRDGHGDIWNERNRLEKEYKKALYWMKLQEGEPQYPDANSTMRISYGTVGGFFPSDGVWYNWYSTPSGILQKYDPDRHDFDLNDRQKRLLQKGFWGKWGFKLNGRNNSMIVDFLTDNDITGGNSGSPVLDAKGNLIGLAFDGNTESLASDASFTQGYNKCINVDIRFVMWVLDKYAGMKLVVNEIDFVN